MKNDEQNTAEHHEDVEACLATPKGTTRDQDDLEGMTRDELVARVRTLGKMLKQRVREVDRLYQEGRSPRGVIEMLQQELHAERERVVGLRLRLREAVPAYAAPIAGMTFPFTIDTPHRDTVEITVTGVGIVGGKHRVHMTADIRLLEAQPQEAPSPVVEPTFVEVRDVPGVVTQLSLDLDVAPPPPEPVTEPVAPPPPTGNTAGKSQEHLNLLAYEQSGAVAANAPKLTAADTNEPAATSSTELVTRTAPDAIGGWEVLKDKGGRPLVRDTDIGERAGLSRPRDIRGTIKANREELEELGPLRAHRARKAIPAGFGTTTREVDEFWLNERQALYLVQRLRTPDSKEMNKNALNALMGLFDYYRDMPPAVPDSTMDWHKYSMGREQLRLDGLRLLEEKNSKTVALLKVENDGMAGVITAQYAELTEYRAFVKNDDSDSGVSTVALSLGYNEQFFFSLMREHGLILSGRKGGWSYGLHTDPYKEYIDKGWFVVRPNLRYRKVHPYTKRVTIEQGYTTRITNLGAFELTRMYGKNGTHWNSDKPAASFHISPNNREVTEEERLDYQRKLWSVWDEEARAAGRPGKPFPEYKVTKKGARMSTWADHEDPNASCAGFRMSEPDPDHSSLYCPCGSTFTWSGLDAGLEVWIKEHTPHQSSA